MRFSSINTELYNSYLTNIKWVVYGMFLCILFLRIIGITELTFENIRNFLYADAMYSKKIKLRGGLTNEES